MKARKLVMREEHGHRRVLAVVLVATAVLLAPPSWSADLFVDAASGADANDGLSWASAKRTVNAALAAATASGEADVVTVATGEYRERIVMPAGVTLIGSVPAGGGPQDVMATPSVLDAEYRGRVVYFGPGTDTSVLDGFVVTRGYLNDPAGPLHGAGIRVEEAGVLIRNCRIEGNQASTVPGISSYVGRAPAGTPPVRLEDCLVRSNRVIGSLAQPVIVLEYYLAPPFEPLEPVLRNVVVEDNEGDSVAGTFALTMVANKASIALENVIVRRNFGHGMALALQDGASLINCEVSKNTGAGAFLRFAGPSPWEEVRHYSLINCTFRADGFPALDGASSHIEARADLEMRRCIVAGTGQDIRSSDPGSGPGTIRFTTGGCAINAVMDNLILQAPANLLPTNIDVDPEFASGPLGDSYLSQVVSGQLVTSPAVDEGDVAASDVGMDGLTTRTDGVNDMDACDLGVHYGFAREAPPFVERFRIIAGQDRPSMFWRADTTDHVWVDDPGALSDPFKRLIYYEVQHPTELLMVTKELVTDSVRLSF